MYNVSREPVVRTNYRSYVEANADVPDYSQLKEYKQGDGNRYIVCLLVAN